jgi:hypothetical protein
VGSNKRRRALHKANRELGTPRAVKTSGPSHVKPTERKKSYLAFRSTFHDLNMSFIKVFNPFKGKAPSEPPHSPSMRDDK